MQNAPNICPPPLPRLLYALLQPTILVTPYTYLPYIQIISLVSVIRDLNDRPTQIVSLDLSDN